MSCQRKTHKGEQALCETCLRERSPLLQVRAGSRSGEARFSTEPVFWLRQGRQRFACENASPLLQVRASSRSNLGSFFVYFHIEPWIFFIEEKPFLGFRTIAPSHSKTSGGPALYD